MTRALREHRRVHFMGIGGIGMSALARLLVRQGHEVSGCDRGLNEQTQALADIGVRIYQGHDPAHADGVDLMVYTAAISSDSPELCIAQERGIPAVKRAELLATIMNAGQGIAVAGTHGKTSTSSLISWILTYAGLDPTVLIGGISLNLGTNARVGGQLIVVEADEYDGSFLRLGPSMAVITNAEADHLDFYGNEESVLAAFRQFAHNVRDTLIVCADDPALVSLVQDVLARVFTYGIQKGDVRVQNVREHGGRMHFDVVGAGDGSGTYETTLVGLHNACNATAAIATASHLGVEQQVIAGALREYRGVARRVEIKGEARGVMVIDDYAHHPTEIVTTLAGIKQRFGRPAHVLFQPHTYSRTSAFLPEFATSFADADALYLLDIYAAREHDTLGVSTQDLLHATRLHHPCVAYVRDVDEAIDTLVAAVRTGDMIVTMGAGDVTSLGPQILDKLKQM